MRTEAILLIRCNCFEMWWQGTELNRRRQPFQGCALPPELPGHVSKPTVCGREGCSLHAGRVGVTGRNCSTPETCGTTLIIATGVISLNGRRPETFACTSPAKI